MPRILYISDALTTHDVRFLAALKEGGHEIRHLPIFPPAYQASVPRGVEASQPLAPDFNTHNLDVWDAARRRLTANQLDFNPHAVVAGPAPSAGFLAAWSGVGPLLLTLWGWDVLVAPNDSPRVRRMVEYTLRRADLILADCQTVKRRAIDFLKDPESAFERRSSPSGDARSFQTIGRPCETGEPRDLDEFSFRGVDDCAGQALDNKKSTQTTPADSPSKPISGAPMRESTTPTDAGGLDSDFCAILEDRLCVFPYGVELHRFENAASGRALRDKLNWNDHRILLHTRSFEPRYGVLEFLEAFAHVASALDDVRAIVLGDGSLRAEVHAAVRRLGIGTLVLLPGRIPEPDLPPWFHAADIYVSAAHSDGTSISLLEAMAAGLPVITSDAPGNREWVTPGDNGWLHRAGDSDDLAETLALALAADTRLMSRANLAQVHRRADWTRNAQKLRDAVDRLIHT